MYRTKKGAEDETFADTIQNDNNIPKQLPGSVLENSAKFRGKRLPQSLFFNKVGKLYLKRDFDTGVFL